jgi:hypothetical protein
MPAGPNPKLYRELSEPFPSAEAGAAAVEAFIADMEEARKKHRIPDVSLVLGFNAVGSDDSEGTYVVNTHYGDSLKAVVMLADAYGRELSRHEEIRAALLGKKRAVQTKS